MSEHVQEIEAIRKAFEQEFERFADLSLDGTSLPDAESLLREIGDLKVRHTGKKSPIAETKKLIGKVSAEERGTFGQLVQSVGKTIAARIAEAETLLNEFILNARIE